ncbi:hypothetical protein I549_1193 [Mycobacterium avium subsp. avium 2285 (R)]|nr:hypothetical protein I549_1193 [Mycobacterium avium subsp. avium 2285 (R)]
MLGRDVVERRRQHPRATATNTQPRVIGSDSTRMSLGMTGSRDCACGLLIRISPSSR